MTEQEADPPLVPIEPTSANTAAAPTASAPHEGRGGEAGGPRGPEPTRYGDWERAGRCIDF